MAEKKTLLEVMTKALKDGRNRRTSDRQALDGDLKEAIENRDLLDQVQACLADLPFRIIVEHQDTKWT